jgi:ubiquinone biosynthesis accessory factor UbiK
MSKPNFLSQLVAQLSEALPSHVGTLKSDFEKNCRAILSQAFSKFDLVTREEFDAQTKVLARTRKKLEELEKHVKTLESPTRKKSD